MQTPARPTSEGPLERVLNVFSIGTMLLTIPQVVTVWFSHNASGVSLVSWSAYLASAVLWFVHGVKKRDASIWVACIGWIVLDAAVVVGIVVRQR